MISGTLPPKRTISVISSSVIDGIIPESFQTKSDKEMKSFSNKIILSISVMVIICVCLHLV